MFVTYFTSIMSFHIILILLCCSSSYSKIKMNSVPSLQRYHNSDVQLTTINKMINISGGEVISGKKNVKELFGQVLPATRGYLFLCLFCTIVEILGLPAPALFSIDRTKLIELWRPFTSVAYLGPPSMSMANSLYFLIRYGQSLESSNGTGAHMWFLLVQTFILTFLGLFFGFPFQAQAIIAAIVYISSRVNAMEKIPFQFGLVITSWQLPFCMMIIDCLSQQSISAAWPHVLGIFSGHCYHFFTEVWPSLGGKARLLPPKWFIKKFGGKLNSNIKGFDFRKDSTESDDKNKLNKNKKYKINKFSKGKKLGSS